MVVCALMSGVPLDGGLHSGAAVSSHGGPEDIPSCRQATRVPPKRPRRRGDIGRVKARSLIYHNLRGPGDSAMESTRAAYTRLSICPDGEEPKRLTRQLHSIQRIQFLAPSVNQVVMPERRGHHRHSVSDARGRDCSHASTSDSSQTAVR